MKREVRLFALVALLASTPLGAVTRTVGPGKQFAAPCAAIAAAQDGDTIEIDAGTYAGDVCAVWRSNLTLRGVGGRAVLDANGRNAEGKAIWVIKGANTVVENIEFTDIRVADRNGAGIRQEGANLTVRNSLFHHCEMGILTGVNLQSQILIENSEFHNNGYGDGYSHAIYIGKIGKFTLRSSYSHDGVTGHLVKSRAVENHILYNRLTGESGTSSYEIDLPNGGRAVIVGNLIQQGANSPNGAIVSYGAEGFSAEHPHDFAFVNNTVVNNRFNATFVQALNTTVPIRLSNNIFFGPGTVTNQSNALLTANQVGDCSFVAAPSFDYRLRAGSPCIDTGSAAVTPLPDSQYVHPASRESRSILGVAIDKGAFEYAGGPLAQRRGDLNNEGTVNVTDHVILANYLVGNLQPGTAPFVASLTMADLNLDGVVNVGDSVVLAAYLAGNLTTLDAAAGELSR